MCCAAASNHQASIELTDLAKPDVQKIIDAAKSVPSVIFDVSALLASGSIADRVEPIVNSLMFSEGPAWSPQGFLVFSDVPQNRIYQWSPRSGLHIFRQPSGQANGNIFLPSGDLITCEHETRSISITRTDGTYGILASGINGKAFNSPNDAALAPDGSVWFTDPTYGLNGREQELKRQGIYRVDLKSGAIQCMIADFDQPNGIAFSQDGARLYVADSGEPCHVRVFDVANGGGYISNSRVFVRIVQGAPDGICTHPNGDIYIAAGNGVQVYHANGVFVALIPTPLPASNVCFGGELGDTLFITARNSLFRLRMPRAVREAVQADVP